MHWETTFYKWATMCKALGFWKKENLARGKLDVVLGGRLNGY